VKQVKGIEAISENYDALLVDAWGVLHDGVSCYAGVKKCLQHLSQLNKPVIVLSNAARRHDAIARELLQLGITPELYRGVLSSGELAWHALNSTSNLNEYGNSGYYFGPERSRSLCEGLPVRWVNSLERADFVLNTGAPAGNPPDTSALVTELEKMLDLQLPMLCANPDQLAIRGGEMGISAGAIARHYRSLGAKRVIYYGKPQSDLFEKALEALPGIDSSRLLMVGDAFETDIAGATNFHIDSLLIADGIHRVELTPLSTRAVETLANRYAVAPTYFCQSFCW
jgi:HAD superfamily hydrolase (TIGR01459 family)